MYITIPGLVFEEPMKVFYLAGWDAQSCIAHPAKIKLMNSIILQQGILL